MHLWASCYSNWLHLLSGGFDSSSALSFLRSAPTVPIITSLTHYGRGPGVDERNYARIAVEAAKCNWIQDELDESASLLPFHEVTLSPRPGLYLSSLHERRFEAIARRLGAGVISNGNGGDALFGQIKDLQIAGDYLHDNGLRMALFQVLTSTAELTQTAVGQVLRHALTSLWGRPRYVALPSQFRMFARLLSSSAIEAVERAPERYAHAWVRDATGLPRAKMHHIAMLSLPVSSRTLPARPGGPHWVHPLWSRHTIEVSAATPTYLLSSGGRTRAIARAAFSEDVPAPLLARRSKGNPSTYVANLIAANPGYVRERLLEGQLRPAGSA